MPLRGDKVILETTRKDYLTITRVEVYVASLSGGTMKKTITKNVRYDKYNNFCANKENEDIQETWIKEAGKELNTCLAMCAKNHSKCSGVEHYASGWDGKFCFHILHGLTGRFVAA